MTLRPVAVAPPAPECARCRRDSCDGTCGGFVPAADLMATPATQWIVESVLPANGVTVLVGESGSGKTFIATGQAADIADGRDWFGLETERGSVAYASFEGDALGLRFQALKDHGSSLQDVYVMRATDPISPRVLRDGIEEPSIGEATLTEQLAGLAGRLAAAGRPPIVALYIDTVRASMTGSEDSSEDVSAYLRAVRRILSGVPGAGVVLVHHSGWQDGDQKRRRERGSSAFRGNADCTLYVELDEEEKPGESAHLVIKTLKTRDADKPAPIRVIRQRVDVLGTDRRGNPLTSCIVVRDGRTREAREAVVAAKAEAEDQAMDIRTLKAIYAQPAAATSQENIRRLVGAGKALVSAALARLIRAGLVTLPVKHGEPYTLTDRGRKAVEWEAGKR